MSPTTLTFPHTELTPVLGKPTNSSIQLLQRQLYTNARSITSPRGGGNNGHLALLMSDFDYFARAGIAFTIPVHPDVAPVHSVGATSAQIAETIRLYNQELAAHTLYHQVSTALKSQILAAVEITYLRALENADFGFADVTPLTMLKHLKTTYGVLTPEALEANRSTLTTPWNPDDPIEDLWKRIEETQRIATTGGAPITDEAVIALTLTMFEKSGLLAHTTQIWRVKPIVYWNWTGFKTDFTMANTERRRQITAGAAGYHGAHAAITPPQEELAALAITPTAPFVTVDGGKLYYCWTHGLGTSAQHTSATCLNKAHGHKDNATIFRRYNGSDVISFGKARRNDNGRNGNNRGNNDGAQQ